MKKQPILFEVAGTAPNIHLFVSGRELHERVGCHLPKNKSAHWVQNFLQTSGAKEGEDYCIVDRAKTWLRDGQPEMAVYEDKLLPLELAVELLSNAVPALPSSAKGDARELIALFHNARSMMRVRNWKLKPPVVAPSAPGGARFRKIPPPMRISLDTGEIVPQLTLVKLEKPLDDGLEELEPTEE